MKAEKPEATLPARVVVLKNPAMASALRKVDQHGAAIVTWRPAGTWERNETTVGLLRPACPMEVMC